MEFTKDSDPTQVVGYLFKFTGKWKYEVMLDYTGMIQPSPQGEDLVNLMDPITGGFINADEAAILALAQATRKGTSGVTISDIGNWTLVVPEPPNGFPVMVVGVLR